MEFFVGTGQKTITLARLVQQVTNAYATLSTPNTATGSFSANPSPGDTVTIGPAAGAWQASHLYAPGGVIIVSGFVFFITFPTSGTALSGATQPTWVFITGDTVIDGSVIWTCQGPSGLATGTDTYTFVAALDNTQFGQVLIGASAANTCQNLVDAINAVAALRTVEFSLPTWECSQCNAVNVVGSSFTLQQKAAGTGWVAAMSTTSVAFSWSAPQTSGGTSPQGSLGPNEGATISLQVYVAGTSTASPGLAYTPGSPDVTLATPLNPGSNLNVEYTRADGNIIEVEDTALVTALAAISHGTGKYQQITDASTQGLISTSSAAGLQLAQQALAAYSVTPQGFEFKTFQPGLFPGMTLDVALTLPTGGTAVLNGNWVIEEVTAEFMLAKEYFGSWGHYRYTIKMVDISEIGSYLDFWEGLGGGGSGSGGGGTGSSLVATSGGALNATGPVVAQSFPAVAHEFLISYDSTTGLFVAAQPVEADVAGLVADLAAIRAAIGGGISGTHSESLTDGNSNFIFANGDIVTVVGCPN
jgi:hypothetical protein